MVRINLIPDIRKQLRLADLGRELVQYSLIFLGMTAIFCVGLIGWTFMK